VRKNNLKFGTHLKFFVENSPFLANNTFFRTPTRIEKYPIFSVFSIFFSITHWNCIPYIEESGNCVLDPYLTSWFDCYLQNFDGSCEYLVDDFCHCDEDFMADCEQTGIEGSSFSHVSLSQLSVKENFRNRGIKYGQNPDIAVSEKFSAGKKRDR